MMTGGGKGEEEGALSRGRPPEGGGSEDELQGEGGGIRRIRAEKKERNLILSLEEISLLKYFAQKDFSCCTSTFLREKKASFRRDPA